MSDKNNFDIKNSTVINGNGNILIKNSVIDSIKNKIEIENNNVDWDALKNECMDLLIKIPEDSMESRAVISLLPSIKEKDENKLLKAIKDYLPTFAAKSFIVYLGDNLLKIIEKLLK